MDRYTIGIITKPHGVRGAVKVNPITDDVARFKNLEKVFINSIEHKVILSQYAQNEAILTLDDITSRDMAELLRGKEVQVEKADAVKLEEGRYFIVDIIGCEVFVSGTLIGKVQDVLQNGAADVYVIKGEKELMVPALKTLLNKVDVDNKQIVFNKDVFDQVVCYED